jgi:hypothetical protein
MGVSGLYLTGRKQGNLGRRLCTDVGEQRFQTAQMAKVVHRTKIDRHPVATCPNCGGHKPPTYHMELRRQLSAALALRRQNPLTL